jgi:hypothetical protein
LSSVFQKSSRSNHFTPMKEQTMKSTLLMFGLAGALALSVAAHAQTTYDTTGSWDGSSSIAAFGNPNTATYGQTFVAPGGNLTDFTFYVNPEGNTLSMEADVFAWSGSLIGGNGPQGAVGPALYTSGPGAFVISGSGFQAVKVNTGGTPLTAGSNYVALLTVSEPSDYAATTGGSAWGDLLFNHVAGDGGGGFNFDNNGNNHAALNNGNWDDFADFGDLAWTAHFSGVSATPEPGAYATIASLGLTGAAFLRRRRAR